MKFFIRAISLVLLLVLALLIPGCKSVQQSGGQPSTPSMPTPSGQSGSPKPPASSSGSSSHTGKHSPSAQSSGKQSSYPSPAPSSPAGSSGPTATSGSGQKGNQQAAGQDGQSNPASQPTFDTQQAAASRSKSQDQADSSTSGSSNTAEGSADATTVAGNDGWDSSNEVPPAPDGKGNQTAGGSAQDADADGNTELDAALGDFDGAIMTEREIIIARSNETAGSGSVDKSLPPAPVSAQNQSAGSGNSGAGAAPDATRLPTPRNSPPRPVRVAKNQAKLPNDIPDAKDDDVVARQLREAAMKESDPVLRAKLWDEYRRYKNGR